jgi:hypothetical protein
MPSGETQFPHKLQALGEFVLGLTRETDNDIRGDGNSCYCRFGCIN